MWKKTIVLASFVCCLQVALGQLMNGDHHDYLGKKSFEEKPPALGQASTPACGRCDNDNGYCAGKFVCCRQTACYMSARVCRLYQHGCAQPAEIQMLPRCTDDTGKPDGRCFSEGICCANGRCFVRERECIPERPKAKRADSELADMLRRYLRHLQEGNNN